MIDTVVLCLALGMVSIGGFMYWPALDHLKPEFKQAPGRAIFWRPERFTLKGQRLLRRAWRVQLLGLALFALLLLYSGIA